jgi:hypothetical protein
MSTEAAHTSHRALRSISSSRSSTSFAITATASGERALSFLSFCSKVVDDACELARSMLHFTDESDVNRSFLNAIRMLAIGLSFESPLYVAAVTQ